MGRQEGELMEETGLSTRSWEQLEQLHGDAVVVEATRRLIVATKVHGDIMNRLTWSIAFFTLILVVLAGVQIGLILDK